MFKNKSLVSLTLCALLFSCSTPLNNLQYQKINNKSDVSSLGEKVYINTPIEGKVEFPNIEGKFKTQATVTDIGTNATVALIYPSDHPTNPNKTQATGLTNAGGTFTINTGFTANTGDIFVLEAIRRIGSTGNFLMTVRTYMKWTGSAWSSITTGGVSINSKTTALVGMINLLSPSVLPDDSINTISSGTPTDIKRNGTGPVIINASSINSTADLVVFALSKNQDPTSYLSYSNGLFKLKEPSDITNVINTYAGIGSTTFLGDGFQAPDARLTSPNTIVRDSSGNIYISDNSTQRVRKISPSGVITTFAGTGTGGSTINSTSSSLTQLNIPQGLAVDSSNNLYISESGNSRVLKINSSGTSVERFVGTGTSGSTINSTSASLTQLFSPQGLIVDSSNNIYVSDSGNNRVLKINSSGTSVERFVGTGTSGSTINSTSASLTQLANPQGLIVDSSNNLYVSDGSNHRVLKINSLGMSVQRVAGTGTSGSTINSTSASLTQLNTPRGLSIDSSNNLYVSESGNHRALKINSSGTSVERFVGTGTSGSTINSTSASLTNLNNPQGLAVDSSNNLYVSEQSNARVLKINSTGTNVERFAGGGVGDNNPSSLAVLNNTDGMVRDSSGNIYIAEVGTHRVRKISPSGTITTFAGTGTSGSTINSTSASLTNLNNPQGLAVDSSNNIYISEYFNHRVLKINSTGTTVERFAGTGTSGSTINSTSASSTQISQPNGLAVDSSNNVYISENTNSRVLKINSTGTTVERFAGTGTGGSTINSTSASLTQLATPFGLALDNLNNLYISEIGNNRILKINSSGTNVERVAGTGTSGSTINSTSASLTQLATPFGLALDNLNNLYISDSGNNRILKINSTGNMVNILAGTGTSGFYGDNLSSEFALLSSPRGLLFDTTNNSLYVSDSSNNRVRKIEITKSVAP